jgi:hypothetical protein
MRKPVLLLTAVAALALSLAGLAGADSLGPITFEAPTYTVGGINGQNGWTKTGSYDAAVAPVASYPAAAGYGFGAQALRISSSVTSGSFGDQTFAPPLTAPASEASSTNHFEASFSIGTAVATQQPGLALSVSPDDGTGGRMSYLRFEDQVDGVHVFFDDVTDNGPVGTAATFNEHNIATLSRTTAHTVKISIDFNPGPGNDVVKVWIDGVLKATGGSWENYYRYDPEQTPTGNKVPVTRTLLFREGPWAAASGTAGNGFLIDNVSMSSSAQSTGGGGNGGSGNGGQGNGNDHGHHGNAASCKHGGWKTFSSPSFRNQGRCVAFWNHTNKHGLGAGQNAQGDQDDQGDNGHHGQTKIATLVDPKSHGHHGNGGKGEDDQ